ncbi:hypothetical protein [Thiohalocapsa marina]|uniref:hypothetical protein n=1 Tax=Thiohalocapsa marina TaxID=424902 RepID=UPI001478C806|nr:hypothetical protein [Thiohalocapsa marina]
MKQFLKKLWKNEEGAEVVEWVVVVALVVVGAIAAFSLLGNSVETAASSLATTISGALG